MRVLIVGGGPGGLYCALLLKRADPRHDVTVVERNPAGVGAGFGILLTGEPVGRPEYADLETFAALEASFVTLPAREVRYQGRVLRSEPGPFYGIPRLRLIEILQRRCQDVGVRLLFQTRLDDVATVAGAGGGYDLIVAADGAYSRTRAQYGAQFGTTVDEGRRRYCWLGSRRIFDRVRLSFQENEHGFFYAYAYQYDPECSTVIAECDMLAWRRAGLDRADEAATQAYLERAFRDDLDGQPLLAQGSRWSSVLTVQNTRWWCRAGNGAGTPHIVLLGDAAHTAHFTVGLATRAAMLDAATLVAALHDHRDADEALAAYEAERKPVADAAQQQADEAVSWLADVSRHLHFVSLVCGQ